jgi:glycosyltransferase involved in cell wall biosynthesis
MVANLTSRMKRHDLFLQAAAEVLRAYPSAQFVIVGEDPDTVGGYRSEVEYARGLKSLASQLNLNGRVQWPGYVADVPAIMNAVDVLVHPSDRESFGRVAVEAMACGKPVVATRSGGPEYFVSETTGLLAPRGNPAALAAALDQLALTYDRYDPARIRAEAVARFSEEAFARQVEAIYQSAIHG